jgi:hypothetical protein
MVDDASQPYSNALNTLCGRQGVSWPQYQLSLNYHRSTIIIKSTTEQQQTNAMAHGVTAEF